MIKLEFVVCGLKVWEIFTSWNKPRVLEVVSQRDIQGKVRIKEFKTKSLIREALSFLPDVVIVSTGRF